MSDVVRVVRRRAGDLAAAARLLTLRLSGRRAGVALMYHRVAPVAGDPDREFVPALAAGQFEAQLAYLNRRFRLVPATQLQVAAAARRRGQRFPVALTFDDDTATHLEHAAPRLERFGAPATFFLNGHALREPVPYWWEVLQEACDEGAAWADVLPAPVLARARAVEDGEPGPYGVSVAIEELPSGERRALAARVAGQIRADGSGSAGLSASQVRALADRGFDIGFHGHRHEPMSLLSPAALAEELDGGREALAEASGAPLTSIAYPHGRANGDVADAARARGFRVGFTVRPTAVTEHDDPLLLGRVNGATPSLRAFRGALVQALARAR